MEMLRRSLACGLRARIYRRQMQLTALRTTSSLTMGRVSSDRYKQVIKVGIPYHRLNEHLLLYVREQKNINALDENNLCKPGDWVLLRRQEKPIDEGLEHKVERVVYHYGKYIDPITGRRTCGIYYDDEIERLEKIKLDL